MNQLFPSLEQLKQLWQDLTPAARIGTIITIVVCLGLIGFVGYWSSQPEYVALVNDLETGKAAKVIDKLQSENISAKLSFSGRSVLVDSRRWNEARVSIANIVDASQIDSSGGAGGWAVMDPTKKGHWLAEQKEQALAKTISSMKQVESATVHLAIPEDTPFVRAKEVKTASVVVHAQPGMPFGRKHAQAIVMIVASSVEGMQPSQVTVTDTIGNVWTGEDSGMMGGVSNQNDMRRAYELELEQKAESQLTALLGPGRAVVKITADMDFTTHTTKQNTPVETKVKSSELLTEEKTTQNPRTALGSPGVSSNLGGAPATSNTRDLITEKSTSDIKYQSSLRETIEEKLPGRIKRISVAATVQLKESTPATDATEGDETPAEPTDPQISIERIEEVIKMAVGFDEKRKDQITVLEGELRGAAQLAEMFEPTESLWETIGPIARDVSLGLAALVALVLGMMTLKKLRPVEITVPEDTGVSPQRARQVSDMMRLAKTNPDILANVLAAWANEQRDADTDKEAA